LEGLHLENNKIKELPKEIFSMKKLQTLYLNGNKIKKVPEKEINEFKNGENDTLASAEKPLYLNLDENPVCKEKEEDWKLMILKKE